MKNYFLYLLVVVFIASVIYSCSKHDELVPNSEVSSNLNGDNLLKVGSSSNEIKKLSSELEVTIKKNGTFTTSDQVFVNSYPEFRVAMLKISNKIKSKINEDFNFRIGIDGIINYSSNPEIIAIGLEAEELLINDGEMSKELVIEYNKNGISKISNSGLFQRLPAEVKYNIQHAADIAKDKINPGEIIRVVAKSDKTLLLQIVKGIGQNEEILKTATGQGCTYAGFKACVGDYWYLPGVNVVACAVGCAIAELIGY